VELIRKYEGSEFESQEKILQFPIRVDSFFIPPKSSILPTQQNSSLNKLSHHFTPQLTIFPATHQKPHKISIALDSNFTCSQFNLIFIEIFH
jgi:hypothetical protein